VPVDQSPGTYKGTISISSDEGEPGEVNINLTVWDVALPAERHYPALIRIGTRDVVRTHGLDEESPAFWELYFQYLDHVLNNRVDPRGLLSFGFEGRIENENYVLEWTDRRMEKFFIKKGLLQFQLSAAPPGIPREEGEQPFPATYSRYVRQYIEQVTTHARQNGWYNRLTFLCPMDEPRTADEYEAVRR
jgi:hypothetical protein